MSGLREAVDDYLTLRRSLGSKLVKHGELLEGFVDFMDARHAETITVDLAVEWATATRKHSPPWWGYRLNAVRVFARHQQAVDPATEVPPQDLLPARGQRTTPYLFSVDEIARMMKAASTVMVSPLRTATYATLVGLLGATGMRLGEAIGLDRADVDLDGALITIRHAKFDRTRLLPIHPSTVRALDDYTALRDEMCPQTTTFFVSTVGNPLCHQNIYPIFHRMVAEAGIAPGPTPHHLRHSFAVRTLIGWYRDGHDVDARLPLLSTYLGHSNPANTYWYLSASPELFALVGERLEDALGDLP